MKVILDLCRYKCGEVPVVEKVKGPNTGYWCSNCDRFIRWRKKSYKERYDLGYTFKSGKWAGANIMYVANESPSFLVWLMQHSTSPHMRRIAAKALSAAFSLERKQAAFAVRWAEWEPLVKEILASESTSACENQ